MTLGISEDLRFLNPLHSNHQSHRNNGIDAPSQRRAKLDTDDDPDTHFDSFMWEDGNSPMLAY